MPEAVIVDAIRTPVGRAFKGSLASLRPEETLAYVVDVDGETLRPSTAEIAEARWFERTALPRRTTRLARRMVARSYWECWSAPPDE